MTINRQGIMFVVSAPSGTGKTTICEKILQRLPDIKMSVSHTTRKPRLGERNGFDYYFIEKETFEEMIKNDEFIEWAEVYGNLYGTSKKVIDELIKTGNDILLDIDVQGAKSIKKNYPDSVLIFIIPPSLEELEKRLLKRNEDKEVIKKRLERVSQEILQYEYYDYLVINDYLEKAINDIVCIINSERLRVKRLTIEEGKNLIKTIFGG